MLFLNIDKVIQFGGGLNLEKTISVLALLVVFFCSSIASARLNDSEIALGGLAPGMDIAYAISIYGQPDKVSQVIANRKNYSWGKGFDVETFHTLSGSEQIYMINTTANNGISTPRGIHAGSKVDEMLKMYGEAGASVVDTRKDAASSYYYYGTHCSLGFEVRNGIVTCIYVSDYSE